MPIILPPLSYTIKESYLEFNHYILPQFTKCLSVSLGVVVFLDSLEKSSPKSPFALL